jgi:hypothetical protein
VMSACGQGQQAGGGTLDFLRGSWRAERVLIDFRSGQRGTFRGVATFAEPAGPEGAGRGARGGLDYREQGELSFGGHHGPASRSLTYRPGPDGSAEVLFADGRPFYLLDLRSGSCQAEHPCAEDHYSLIARVLGPDSFTEHWRVRGPEKDYEMTTTFARIDA